MLTLSNGQSITIPVGQSTGSVTFTLRPDDALVQGTDSLSVSITGSSGANFEQLATTGTVTNTVVDDLDSTTVTLSSLTNGAALTEGGSITYAASVGAAVAGSPLVLTLSNGQSITIPVGQSTGSVTFTLRPDDALVQGTDSLSVSITGSSGANFEQLATTGTVTNTVVDDLDSTTVTLSSLTNGAALTEGGSITYAASVGAAVAGSPLVLTLSNGQSITIPVGQSTGSVTFTLRPDDALVQGTDSLSVSITGSSGANFEQLATTGTVTNTVVDDLDSTTVTLSSLTNGAALTEGGSITYAASVGAAVAGSPLVLTLSNGQSITIPVGQSTGSVTFTLRPDDALVQGTDSLSVSITGSSGANFEQLATTGTVTNTVVDDLDSTTVTLSSLTNGAALTEGGSITYAASVGAAVAGSPLVLTLSNGQSITIPVGQSTGSVISRCAPTTPWCKAPTRSPCRSPAPRAPTSSSSPPPAPSPTRWSMTSTRPPSR